MHTHFENTSPKLRSRALMLFIITILPLFILFFHVPKYGYTQISDDETITTPNFNYIVHWTDGDVNNDGDDTDPGDFPPGDPNIFTRPQAQIVADALDTNMPGPAQLGHHALFINHGFNTPFFSTNPSPIRIYDSTVGSHANFDRICIDSQDNLGATEIDVRSTVGHELFHHVQYDLVRQIAPSAGGCGVEWPGWMCEGTARLMQDKIYTDLDLDSGTVSASYPGEVNDYLADPDRSVWNVDSGYGTALFWNYLTEQLGTTNTEPELGIDFIRDFWASTTGTNHNGRAILRDRIRAALPGVTLEDLFHDFTIANAAKDLNQSNIDPAVRNRSLPFGITRNRYAYIDDDAPTTTYNEVLYSINQTMTTQIGPQSDDVVDWGAKYYKVTGPSDGNPANDPDPFPSNCEIVGFRSTGDMAAYGLLAVRAANSLAYLGRMRGKDVARVVYNDPSDPLEQIIAVVAGLEDSADYDYSFSCGRPSLKIRRPNYRRVAFVGEPNTPERFLVFLEVRGPESLGKPSIMGLRPTDFEVYVGNVNPANAGTILSGGYVQDGYWLVVQAPSKPQDGVFELRVRLGNTEAGQDAAVAYHTIRFDMVEVIDTSGSMASPSDSPKVEAAKIAARLFLNAASDSDNLGVISFNGDDHEPNDDSTVEHPLGNVGSGRDAARVKIESLEIECDSSSSPANCMTSIGDGLKAAQNQLISIGQPQTHNPVIILLSDGMENEALFWKKSPTVKPDIVDSSTIVYSIALGSESDQALLQEIANETEGDYFYESTEDPTGGGNPIPRARRLPNRLSNAYKIIAEDLRGQERLYFNTGTLEQTTSANFSIPVGEDGVRDASFTFTWSDPARVDVVMTRPNGTPVNQNDASVNIIRDLNHVVFKIDKIEPGKWSVKLTSNDKTMEYMAILSGKLIHGVNLNVLLGQAHEDATAKAMNGKYLRGLPMPIMAILTDSKGPVTSADVFAEIEAPDEVLTELKLYDDGNHGDGEAGDGLYANLYTRTALASVTGVRDDVDIDGTRGSYTVDVIAKGRYKSSQRFTRIGRLSFQVFDHEELNPDEDKDGMPTRWETQFGLNPLVNDASNDPDRDGVKNIQEFMNGTYPDDPDSDNGGESDGSESARKSNPFNPFDDALSRPIDVEVVVNFGDEWIEPSPLKPNTNLIRIPIDPAYTRIHLFRSKNPNQGFSLVRTIDAATSDPLISDTGLTNGTTYYYYLVAEGANRTKSAPSKVFAGTPRSDPMPPYGFVTINNHARITNNPNVKIFMNFDSDTKDMMISNTGSFAGSVWEPVQARREWRVKPDPQTGIAFVYVKFRDAAGNVSVTYHDGILVR